MKPAAPAPVATVDTQNPWLGLVSFTEETRGYFHGREEEAAELSRRVQRKLLTVLFGQSGLGKTSILQAGLVPRLRPEGFCPVYVRLDYDPHSPPPAEQIKRAVFRATDAAGRWTKTGAAVTGETLWEFLHHRDDVLQDASGRTLTPLLIFDQFEEIFTLAQGDEAGRQRAQEFLADLADLVENRPPAALEARIDRDETDAARFDFARADYRILISLREDYLAHLEGLKDRMPSVTQNRMRLARMTGAQALAAVRRPAPQLVSEGVAEAIVRFVAGGSSLTVAEVEPSLLSLICRELNNTRLAQGQGEISADLLAGSRDTILSEFYERTLADQPAGVRIFVEDEMLTDSGFRESVGEERVRKALAAAGAPEGALAQLVDRRLLRAEDRLDQRRVEITHDVLCSVIAASRNVRREREALAAKERELSAQREREAATRRQLTRARLVAAIATVLMLAAAGSAVFGWINYRRAVAAEAQAARARVFAEQARGQSEKLIGFLLEDFYEELKPTGRVEVVEKLADKAIAYYEALPAELRTPQTRLYEGMALARKASALSEAGKLVESAKVADRAQAIFEELRGDPAIAGEATVGLALSHFSRSAGGLSGLVRENLLTAVRLLEPSIKDDSASRAARIIYVESLNRLAGGEDDYTKALAMCEEARAILQRMGAGDLSDLTAASIYGDVTDSQARLAWRHADYPEANRLASLVGEYSRKVIERRPGDLRAMENRYFSADVLGNVALEESKLDEAERHFAEAAEAAKNHTLFNPANGTAWRAWADTIVRQGTVLLQRGEVDAAIRKVEEAAALARHPANRTGANLGVMGALRALMDLESQRGNFRSARVWLQQALKVGDELSAKLLTDPEVAAIQKIGRDMFEIDILVDEGAYATLASKAAEWDQQIRAMQATSEGARSVRQDRLRQVRNIRAEAALRLGRTEEALTVTEEILKNPMLNNVNVAAADGILARQKTRRGHALIQAGRRDEAKVVLTEALGYFRSRQEKGDNGILIRADFAHLLYVLALAEPADAQGRAAALAHLDEAMAMMGELSLEARQLVRAKELIGWISSARRELAGS
jgi:tetratricopeptide (TPR) repeat protein